VPLGNETPEPVEDATLTVRRGTCSVLFAYEVAQSIDLDACEHRMATLAQRAKIRHKRRAPAYFEYHPPPLRITQSTDPVVIRGLQTAPQVDLVLYDFGAVSVGYAVPLGGELERLIGLSGELADHSGLLRHSRERVAELVQSLGPAVRRPQIADFVESYVIFQIQELGRFHSAGELVGRHSGAIAQLLRSEGMALSDQEIRDALACRISFTPNDLTVVDWDAAVVFDQEADDVLAVLEFANVELLEMRYLDQQLDDALDQAYEAMSRRTLPRFYAPGTSHADLSLVAQLQVDSAILFEGVNNTLKLLGDQYLARLYRLVSQRFHLGEWDASILRKLSTLESIYGKMADLAANRRMEVLEWIIIILIALSIVVGFIPGLGGK
jgi:hypothetical protein